MGTCRAKRGGSPGYTHTYIPGTVICRGYFAKTVDGFEDGDSIQIQPGVGVELTKPAKNVVIHERVQRTKAIVTGRSVGGSGEQSERGFRGAGL